LNEEGVPPWGKSQGWQVSYIKKILTNGAVTGLYQPHKKTTDALGKRVRVPEGEPIYDYYPQVIDTPTFKRAERLRTSRRIKTGRTSPSFNNLFSGLTICGNCGGSMSFQNKGPNWKYLQCSNAKRSVGNCTASPFKYTQDREALILITKNLDQFF